MTASESATSSATDDFTPIRYADGVLYVLDQRQLPAHETWVECRDEAQVADAIAKMVVRGAPAIGCTAAYGVAIAARRLAAAGAGARAFRAGLDEAIERLRATRPTAVNLFWALAQMRDAAAVALTGGTPGDAAAALDRRALAIHAEDVAMCKRIGAAGAPLLPDDGTVLTHCNAGALATGGYGTALGVIRAARAAGKRVRVIADETRPYLQGARLTAWELVRDGFDVTIIPDSAAGFLMRRGEVQCVVVGADRVAANGDVANKIGTYQVALAAAAHGVPFYVAAPVSTIDFETPAGDAIPIEERAGTEMFAHTGADIAPAAAHARYPAFDVTPADLITAIVTDRGVVRPPYGDSLRRAVCDA
ncbi:MAG: S-methyl-5-thioribose-1-phosphate isomerase [Deltaproteobacteria bacterium]|nr:MAG: S-methyl-5-thioribose-1-phosphate isomerase [Deltaproteobacteria bacterium]